MSIYTRDSYVCTFAPYFYTMARSTKPVQTTLEQRIIDARKNKGWTQTQLANALGVNLKNVSRYELGQAKPSFEAAAKLAKALGVSLDYLSGLKEDNNSGIKAKLWELLDKMSKEKLEALVKLLQ